MAHTILLIDAHVHFYGCYSRDMFFDSALANFQDGTRSLGCAVDEVTGCLMFSETSRDHYFREFHEAAGNASDGNWRFQRTAEDCSLIACDREGRKLLLVAGRQIVTVEGLEVLALSCNREFPDGLDLAATVARSRESDAITVIPWGFGKWWFRRGVLLQAFLRSSGADDVYLGDNGGRPDAFPTPAPFKLAAQKGIWLLPGSDPLPFPFAAGKAGSFGFALTGEIDPDAPARGLKSLLAAQTGQPQSYGRPERVVPFVRNQIMMQLRKQGARLWRNGSRAP